MQSSKCVSRLLELEPSKVISMCVCSNNVIHAQLSFSESVDQPESYITLALNQSECYNALHYRSFHENRHFGGPRSTIRGVNNTNFQNSMGALSKT